MLKGTQVAKVGTVEAEAEILRNANESEMDWLTRLVIRDAARKADWAEKWVVSEVR